METKLWAIFFAFLSLVCTEYVQNDNVREWRSGWRMALPQVMQSTTNSDAAQAWMRPLARKISESYLHDSEECDLACWLEKLVFTIPTISKEKLGTNVTISNIICGNLVVGNLTSSLPQTNSITADFQDLVIRCNATWKASNILDTLGGDVVAAVGDGSSFQLGLEMFIDGKGLSNGAEMTTCKLNALLTELEFKGAHGVINDILNTLKAPITDLIEYEMDKQVCTQLNELINVNFTQFLLSINSEFLPYFDPADPVLLQDLPGMVNMEEGNAIVGLANYLCTQLLDVNYLVNKVTNGTGVLRLSQAELMLVLPNSTFSLDGLGNITVGLLSVELTGLDTWKQFDLLYPIGPYNLKTSTRLDTFTLNATFFLNVSTTDTGPVHDTAWLYEEAQIFVDLSKNRLNASLLLEIEEHALASLNSAQLEQPGCLVEPLHALNLTQVSFDLDVSDVVVTPLHGDIEREFDALIDHVLALLVHSFEQGIPAVLNFASNTEGLSLANTEIRTMLTNVTQTYGCKPGSEQPLISVLWTVVGAATGIAVWGVVIFLGLIWRSSSSPYSYQGERTTGSDRTCWSLVSAWCGVGQVESDDDDSRNSELSLLLGNEESQDREAYVGPLLASPRVHWVFAYGVPLVLLMNMALFVSSNTSAGASVYLFVTVDGEKRHLPSFFTFSLYNTVTDMWKAKVYPLSILVALFSGLWPYAKLVLMLICWVFPVGSASSSKAREICLRVLDALGKWSLLDTYVMVLFMVAFRFHIVPPTEQGTVNIDVYVTPDLGFYTFLIATMLSLIMTHIILAFDRHATSTAKAIVSDDRQSLMKYSIHTPYKLLNRSVQWGITLGLVLSVGLVLAGISIPSFEFEFRGLAGWALDFLGLSVANSYSVVLTGGLLPLSSPDGVTPGLLLIQSAFIIFAMLMPLLHLTILFILWVAPMTPLWQRRFFVASEVANAWAALEVFVVSILAGMLEIQTFAQFILGGKCDLINQILKMYFKDALDGDPKCFDVIGKLLEGCWLLFGAVAFTYIFGWTVMQLAHKALEHREKSFHETLPYDEQDDDYLINE